MVFVVLSQLHCHACLPACLQVVFAEASAAAGHTVDRVISIMDANGLTLSALTGFAQRVRRHTEVQAWHGMTWDD